MNKVGVSVVVLAALGMGWLLGSLVGGGAGDALTLDREVVRLRDEVARLHLALGERGPVRETTAGLGGGGAPGEVPGPGAVERFDIQSFDDADEAFQALLAFTRSMLAKGKDGHLTLVDTLDATFFDKSGETLANALLGSEERADRFLYPVLRFALNHESEVADLTETVFETMARDPRRLETIGSDTLGIFAERIAPMLPGMVGPTRLETFRRHGRAILATPVAEQPRSVQRSRGRVQRAMESWAPPIGAQEAAQRLRQGGVSPEESLALLRRLGPADLARLDIDDLVGPLLERDPHRVIAVLTRIGPDGDTLARLDQRVLTGLIGGTLPPPVLAYWLRFTRRQAWGKARIVIEAGLQRGDEQTAGLFLVAALAIEPGPDEAWVAWAERTYEFSDRARAAVRRWREKR